MREQVTAVFPVHIDSWLLLTYAIEYQLSSGFKTV